MKPQTKHFAALFCPLALALISSAASAAPFYDASPFGAGALQCLNGQCEAAIAKTTYQNRPAYKLTNGAVEAVVVPSIGRVMSFGKTGGPNLLWNNDAAQLTGEGWQNYGGDKAWLSPQSNWKVFHGSDNWPPEAVLDGEPLKADVLTGGKLQLTTGVSKSGIRLIRTMYFDDNGEFVIEQTARKESGAPVKAGIWSITQTVPSEAVFFAIDPATQYKEGFFRFENKDLQPSTRVKPNLVKIEPKLAEQGSKMGFDTKVSALASVKDGMAFVQKSARPDGEYPDGAQGNGFPTELYVNGDPKAYYQELEILGPLEMFAVGTSRAHTVRWSLHELPSSDANSPAVVEAIAKLLAPASQADAD